MEVMDITQLIGSVGLPGFILIYILIKGIPAISKFNSQIATLINEVRTLIFNEFKVEYSLKQVRIILRKFGMKYAKPYPHDFRKPENAEEILKKN